MDNIDGVVKSSIYCVAAVFDFFETFNFLCYQIISAFAINLIYNKRNLAFQKAVKMLQNNFYFAILKNMPK
ncbi:MAG: hypothetical protein JRD71_00875 [Deltaproteobacteria bacterium]|nr:hypothetical protein [Deltaproteobacteria bacterium]